MEQPDKQKQKILVFGAEKQGISVPSEPIRGANYEITFETFEDSSAFDTFDGVILFQGLFEERRTRYDGFGGSHEYRVAKSGELDRRNNEISLLMEKGGFVCFILCQEFYEPPGQFRDTDCVKFWLNGARIVREDFPTSTSLVEAVRSEFKNFFDRYGRAFSSLRPDYDSDVERVELARLGRHTVGFIIANTHFFVPARMPRPSEVENYFKELSEAIISTKKKLTYSIPDWVKKYKFSQEIVLLQRKERIQKVMERIDERLHILERYKRILVASGELLVNAVIDVLQKGFGFKAESCDDLKEDIQITNNEGKMLVLGEVKGVNTGIKRVYIYQAESHRERAKVSNDFPSILIVNTHCKKAGSIEEKDCEVETEQVQLATSLNILVLRTLDLLRLLELHIGGKITVEEVLELFTKEKGWLHVFPDLHYEIQKS